MPIVTSYFPIKSAVPADPNSRLYVPSYGTTLVDFPIMCEFYESVEKGLLKPFYP